MLHNVISFIRKLQRKINLDCIVIKLRWLYFTKPKTMNKVILTHDRMFMSTVCKSGSGKTELMFQMLQGKTFYPRFQKIYYFYKEFQPLFRDMQGKIPQIEFTKYAGFKITKKIRTVFSSMMTFAKKFITTRNSLK